jgi:20S proteasome alpha/beta subunit
MNSGRLSSFLRSLLLVASLALDASAFQQEVPALSLAESAPVLSLGGGTLTVVLANKNGFVIASDSRRTFRDSNAPDENCGNGQKPFGDGYSTDKHCDDSQKLFRLGPHSAMAIAGFASSSREPFATDVAAEVIRSLPRYTDGSGPVWIEGILSSRLQLLQSLNSVEGGPPERLYSYVTIASIAHDGIPKITRVVFDKDQKEGHPRVSTFTGTTFRCAASGETQLVDSVLDGTYDGDDKELRKFRLILRRHGENAMSIHEMAKVSSALVRETAKMSSIVGGPLQMGVFGVGQEPVWQQPVFERAPSTLGQISFYGFNTGLSVPVSMGKPGELVRVIEGSLYSKQRITVDGNVYIYNWFDRCEIETTSLSPLYWRKNTCGGSVWIRPFHKPIPLDEHCVPLAD